MKIIKKFFGVVLCFCAFGFTIATEQIEQSMQPFFIVLVGLCVLGAVLLLKRPKRVKTKEAPPPVVSQGEFVTVQTEYEPDVVPDDIAKEMRKYYTAAQAQRDMEIMAESYKLASTTKNLDTFCMRYDLAMRKAHTLLQAEQVGVRGIKKLNCHDACVAVINAAHSLKIRMLTDYEQSAFTQAEALKTDKGKLNRYIKIKQDLTNAEPTFMLMEEYENLIVKVDAHILSLGGQAL